jgi:hypothetical protein
MAKHHGAAAPPIDRMPADAPIVGIKRSGA